MSNEMEDWGGADFPEPSEVGFADWDTTGVDAEDIGSGRIGVNLEGMYHFEIEAHPRPSPYGTGKDGKPDMTYHRFPDILLICKVLHSAPGQSPAGAVATHKLVLGGKGPGAPIPAWAKEQTLNFLVGLGICKHHGGSIIDPETGSERLKTSTLASRLNGRQFIGKIEFMKGKPKDDKPNENHPDVYGFNFGRGAFAIDDPRVAHVPKNVEALRKIGKAEAAPHASQQPAGAPAKAAASSLPDDM